jgi:predicted ATPase
LNEDTPLLHLTPQQQKQKTLAALLAILLKLAMVKPVCILVEDLHWVDPSTLEMLNFLVEQAATARVLVLFTARPEFDPPWQSWSHLTQLTLHRLGQQQTQAMIEAVTGGRVMPPEVMRQLVTKTDGVPLFVEELTKMVLELGLLKEQAEHYELTGPLPPLAIPATLQESLMARLDRLATVREVAQLSATIGREFSYELLRAISPLDEISLRHKLAQLVEAELLYQRGAPPQAIYTFKHALIQETAYRSLLRSQRQHFHQQLAQILAERFPQIAQTQPELLAYHCTAAGLSEQAIGYWQQAGERAMTRSANVEAIGHLTQAITLLKTLPDTPERAQQELSLQISLGVPLLMTKGYASATIEQTYARVRELCQQTDVGEAPQLFSALFGLWLFHLVRAELATTLELAQELWQVAERLNETTLRLEAHQAQGVTLFYLGEVEAAQAHLEQVITQYNPQQHPAHAVYGGADLGVTCLCHAALALWLQGYPDQALKRSQEALALARNLAQPFSLAFALCLTGWLHQFRRERTLTYERAMAAVALSAEHGFALSSAFGLVLAGWAGGGEAGLSQLRQGLVAYQATGAELGRLQFLSLLAESYAQNGQVEAGLAVVDEALATASQNGERFFEAELYRLKGELLLKDEGERRKDETLRQALRHSSLRGSRDEVETCFHQAIEIARRQKAKSLELRAVMSLSRLWWEQSKQAEAHHLLAEIHSWFKEGFDTADLQEAKVLLAKTAKIREGDT